MNKRFLLVIIGAQSVSRYLWRLLYSRLVLSFSIKQNCNDSTLKRKSSVEAVQKTAFHRAFLGFHLILLHPELPPLGQSPPVHQGVNAGALFRVFLRKNPSLLPDQPQEMSLFKGNLQPKPGLGLLQQCGDFVQQLLQTGPRRRGNDRNFFVDRNRAVLYQVALPSFVFAE